MKTVLGWLAALAFACATQAAMAADPAAVYGQHCAACHGADRLGAMGPALLPESLERLRASELDQVLHDGRAATQMPAFAGTLAEPDLQALARWLRTAPTAMPQWHAEAIRASHIVHHAPGSLPARPVFGADPQNLFVAVEAGSHHMTVLDGDRLAPVHRFATRFALHGAAPSSAATAAMSTWPAAMAGSASTTCGTWPMWRRSGSA